MTLATAADPLVTRYQERTQRSRQLWQRAQRRFPLGVSANVKMFPPYPVSIERGHGASVWDVDGNEYVDVILGAGTHLLGHRHPRVQAAVERQLGRLWQHLVPDPNEPVFAERLYERYPYLERIRYANTGSEAIRNCVRVARAVTGRALLAKVDGHYHGSDDALLVSGKGGGAAGPRERPEAVLDSAGLAPGTSEGAVVLPWNDIEAATALIDEHADQLSCVLLEPIGFSTGGAIATDPAYAAALRERCDRHGIVLIFDEIVMAHRLGPGGSARLLGVTPDLAGLGKAIGGGLPVSVFGGRTELMEEALGSSAAADGRMVFASGTFSGNPLATAAGLAVLDELDDDDPVPRMDELASQLRSELQERFDTHHVAAQVVGASSITQVHFTSTPPRDRRDVLAADRDAIVRFLVGMMSEGVLWTPVHSALLSAAHDEEQITMIIEAADRVIKVMASSTDSGTSA
jgi:glutamate-1-semialdehyde 2,1-aminomutase